MFCSGSFVLAKYCRSGHGGRASWVLIWLSLWLAAAAAAAGFSQDIQTRWHCTSWPDEGTCLWDRHLPSLCASSPPSTSTVCTIATTPTAPITNIFNTSSWFRQNSCPNLSACSPAP